MSDPGARLNASRVSLVGLTLLFVLVVLIRSPSDAPPPVTAAETVTDGQLSDPTADVDGGVAQQAPSGSAAEIPAETPMETSAETSEPPLADGCFRSGSSRAEVRAVMGEPDSVDFGAWVYGASWVTFGYSVVLDYSNEGGKLRLCE